VPDEEFQGDTFAWKDDNGYVPGPGRHCSNKIATAAMWIFTFFNVALGVL